MAPMVLAAGQAGPGQSRSSTRFSLRAPHRMCARRNSSTASSIGGGTWFGCRSGARLRSSNAASPAPSYRRHSR
jgi:hypothetical protein